MMHGQDGGRKIYGWSGTASQGYLGMRFGHRYGANHRFAKASSMAETIVPHFHHTPGVPVIEIGAREFMCIGEEPPFDHPHVFLDMGDASEIICPYCSTLFRYDAGLAASQARPAECMLT